MYRLADVRVVHIELTTSCNAACPMCPRNIYGGRDNPTLPPAELTLSDIQLILTPQFLRQLKLVYMCGNYGDPMVAKDTLPILQYLRDTNPPITLGFHTNGGARPEDWWRRLARVVTYCRFGIDGLADTNAVYRRNTRWTTIMRSVRAFISAGGRAEWDFLVFRHNEHQVAEARELAKTMGFASFNVKRTGRFFSPDSGQHISNYPILNKEDQKVGTIEEPTLAHWRNPILQRLTTHLGGADGYVPYLNTTEIRCKVAAQKSLYLSAEGLVTPCCWLGSFYRLYRGKGNGTELLERIPAGKDALDARKHGLAAIVNGPVFQRIIPESWHRPSIAEGRLEHCARVCGSEDLQGAQHPQKLPT